MFSTFPFLFVNACSFSVHTTPVIFIKDRLCKLLIIEKEEFNLKKQLLEKTGEVSVSDYITQGHPTDRFGGISVRKTCNRFKFSVREMSSRAFLINAFCFRRDKNVVLGTKIGQLGFSER